jgi:hypothetical protein
MLCWDDTVPVDYTALNSQRGVAVMDKQRASAMLLNYCFPPVSHSAILSVDVIWLTLSIYLFDLMYVAIYWIRMINLEQGWSPLLSRYTTPRCEQSNFKSHTPHQRCGHVTSRSVVSCLQREINNPPLATKGGYIHLSASSRCCVA